MRFFLGIFILLLTSCTASIYKMPLSELQMMKIPLETQKVVVNVPYNQMKLLRHIAKYYSLEGFQVQSDLNAMQVSTGFKAIEGGATVRMVAAIDTINGEGSSVLITGEWGLNTEGQLQVGVISGMSFSGSQSPVVYEGSISSTKSGIAFQYMLLTAKSIPAGEISFKK